MFIIIMDDGISGEFSGMCGLCIGHPVDTIKVRQQTFGSTFPKAIQRTFKYEGIHGFFKGMLFPLLTVGPANAIMFGVFGNVMKFFQGSDTRVHKISFTNTSAIVHIYCAGVIAGFFQTLFSCPFDLVKTVLQAKTEGGSWKKHYEVPSEGSIDTFRWIVKSQGIKGLFRGGVPLLIRDVPTNGIFILTYEMLMYHNFSECTTPSVIKQMCAGGIAGLMSWIFVFPFDVVKARIQVDDPKNPKYKNMRDCFRKSYKAEGYKVFFKGAPATIMRTMPVNAAVFIGYEMVLKMQHI